MEYIGKIEYDKDLCVNGNEIVIFGAGSGFEKLIEKLEMLCVKDKIVCVCDNDIEKQGKKIQGIKIVSLEYALNYYKNAAYIVYNQFCIEICRQLIEKGIEKIHLIRN